MQFIADLHIHSKYSRATSKNMDVENLSQWAKYKGIDLLATGDFTHHLWLSELQQKLEPKKDIGLFFYKDIHFMLTAEISNIFSQNGHGYRVHNLVMVPTFKMAKEVNRMLSTYGNISSDGRPILGMSCFQLAHELFSISSDIMLVPAHIWTPWFSVFGSKSGFNSLEEAYGKYADKITALETGLSSDPAMNWRCSFLDKYSLISNSDSHSPQKIGREANVFNCELNYWEIKKALETKDKNKFLYTVEFFPEEGKYHYDGHRNCNIRMTPQETKKNNGICPICKKPVTKGVLNRVDELADRENGFVPQKHIPFKSLVALDEVISESKGVGRASKAVLKEYMDLIFEYGSEFNLLLNVEDHDLDGKINEKIARGIKNVRNKNLNILPGFDGEYGEVKVFEEKKETKKQMTLF